MSEAKHTPGPFTPCDPGDYSDYGGNSIVIIGDDRRIAVVLGKDKESKANAALFSAAPDLLAALKSLRNEVVGQLGIAREQIRAAISTTNLRCLERRAEEAESAIARAEGRS